LIESFDFTLKTAMEHHIIMLDTKIFEAALAINSPWYIKDVQFDVTAKKLDIFIDFKPLNPYVAIK
jgi:hypothetical protein